MWADTGATCGCGENSCSDKSALWFLLWTLSLMFVTSKRTEAKLTKVKNKVNSGKFIAWFNVIWTGYSPFVDVIDPNHLTTTTTATFDLIMIDGSRSMLQWWQAKNFHAAWFNILWYRLLVTIVFIIWLLDFLWRVGIVRTLQIDWLVQIIFVS